MTNATITVSGKGSLTATSEGGEIDAVSVTVKINGSAISALCREMIRQGCKPETKVLIYRLGSLHPLFKPSTVGYWAARTISEGDGPIRVVRWKEKPDGIGE